MYDPYDPEEIRRRQLLSPIEGDDYMAHMSQQVMAPDDEEETAAPIAATPKVSPAMQHFRDVIGQQPTQQKPNKWTQFAAALSGLGAGLQGHNGPEAAQSVLQAPYKRSLESWQNALYGAQLGMTADEKEQAQEVARQRAAAYGVSAQARLQAAQATEKYRQWQQAHTPWQPQNEAEAIEFTRAKQRPVGWQPGSKEEYKEVHPPRDPAAEEAARHSDAMSLEAARAGHEASRQSAHDARIDARVKAGTPKNQEEAEQIAIDELLRQRPEYGAFVHKAVVGKTGKVEQPHRVKTADELPQESSGFLGIGGTSGAQASLAREQYRQFLTELDKHKKAAMGRQQQQSWSIQKEDE